MVPYCVTSQVNRQKCVSCIILSLYQVCIQLSISLYFVPNYVCIGYLFCIFGSVQILGKGYHFKVQNYHRYAIFTILVDFSCIYSKVNLRKIQVWAQKSQKRPCMAIFKLFLCVNLSQEAKFCIVSLCFTLHCKTNLCNY